MIKSAGKTRSVVLMLVFSSMIAARSPIAAAPHSFSGQKSKKSKKTDTGGAAGTGQAPADGGGGNTQMKWQTWGDQPCPSRHTGKVGFGYEKSATFNYFIKKGPAAATTAQAYVLIPDSNNKDTLYAGEELILQITALHSDITDPGTDVPLINVDIESTQATALNPAPLRQSQTVGSAGLTPPANPDHYTCSYKSLVGDTLPTITVTAVLKDNATPLKLMATSLPQVHTLSYFNVASGLVASTIKDTNFSRVVKTPSTPANSTATPPTAAIPATYQTTSQPGDPKIAPVLFFTAYVFHPLDAEVPFHLKDLIPAPSIGLSLTNPSGDFFFGGSSEFFVRNVQLVYGFHWGQVTSLVPNQVNDPYSSTAQSTQKVFTKGAFVGLTFNIDFVKGLFGGGGSAKSSTQ